MDEHILQNLENFEALWQRVSQTALPPSSPPQRLPAGDREILSGLICRSQTAARRYEQLAALFPAPAQRSLLRRQANEEAAQARRLGGEFYLRYGRRNKTPDYHPVKQPRLELLRTAYWAALDSAKQLDSAAEHADESMALLYRQFAADERSRAEENRTLLLQVF